MTDYSKMSDTDIAQKVWFWWNANIEHDNTLCTESGGVMLYAKVDRWVAFDPCNSWADAGPIAQKYLIGLVRVQNGWCAVSDKPEHGGLFFVDKDPCRAICIVFLMMNEGE